MRNATKTAVVAVSAIAAVLAVSVAAFAATATLSGTLTVTPLGGGHYGDELTIMPSMNTTAVPGDIVTIQYLDYGNNWMPVGEGLSVEDTMAPDAVSGLTTIGPLAYLIDEELPSYPAIIRAVFIPKSASKGTAVSSPVWIRMSKNLRTKMSISGPGKVTHGKNYTFESRVTPVSGIGTVKVTVERLSNHSKKVYNVETDSTGITQFNFKQNIKGRYRISERFLGNRFGAASSTAIKTIVVK